MIDTSDCTCEYEYDSDTGVNFSIICDGCVFRGDTWSTEKKIINVLLDIIEEAYTLDERLFRIKSLFLYLRTIPGFIRAHADFRSAMNAKISEFSVNEQARPIHNTIAEMREFVDSLFSDI